MIIYRIGENQKNTKYLIMKNMKIFTQKTRNNLTIKTVKAKLVYPTMNLNLRLLHSTTMILTTLIKILQTHSQVPMNKSYALRQRIIELQMSLNHINMTVSIINVLFILSDVDNWQVSTYCIVNLISFIPEALLMGYSLMKS